MKQIGRYFWIFIIGLGVGILFQRNFEIMRKGTVNAEAILVQKQLRKVMKLVTVELDFAERYRHEQIRPLFNNLIIPDFLLDKKAIVFLDGKALIGYDFANINLKFNSDEKEIYLDQFPKPTILAIDHNITYEYIEESYLNEFTAKDFTLINKNAKELIGQTILENKASQKSEDQAKDILDALKWIAMKNGWKFKTGFVLNDVNNQISLE